MKKLTLAIILITPIAYAQPPMGGDRGSLQNIMQNVQACMSKIDQSQMQVIEDKQMLFQYNMKEMCAVGKRDQAQKQALSFAKEMSNNPMIKGMNTCNKMMEGIIPGMPPMDQQDDYSDTHVCDSLMDY